MGKSEPVRDLTSTIHLGPRNTVKDRAELLAQLSDSDRLAISELPQDRALLISLSASGQGHRLLISEDVTSIGRGVESEIFLSDITVSRRHAQIERSRRGNSSEFLLRDSGSLNGTYVNNVSQRESKLSSGDEVQIGKFRFLFIRGDK
jgi:pSer/pThr/pTyr-binding forkhead associated (FHA) protein